jgi:hypothetical protein
MKLARERGYTSGKPEDHYYGAKPDAPRGLKLKRAAAVGAAALTAAGGAAAVALAARARSG